MQSILTLLAPWVYLLFYALLIAPVNVTATSVERHSPEHNRQDGPITPKVFIITMVYYHCQ